MVLTTSDIILRIFYKPILATYDLTIILAGIVAGFAIPLSTLKGAHVYMGFFIDNIPSRFKNEVSNF
jgi:TRAP-type C4-dicarboxylate transport system permease small subunit